MGFRNYDADRLKRSGAIWTPTEETWQRMFVMTGRKRDYAKQLLDRMTTAEQRLWAELSKENIGSKTRHICPWRPQVVIKGWIVDFYNDHTLKVIEVDGPVHDSAAQQAKDALKDEVLRHFGLRVYRFTNAEVWRDPEGIVREIHGFNRDHIGARPLPHASSN